MSNSSAKPRQNSSLHSYVSPSTNLLPPGEKGPMVSNQSHGHAEWHAERRSRRFCIKDKIYLGLIVLTAVMFLINITQIALMQTTTNIYWIAVCPALTFALLLLGFFWIVLGRPTDREDFGLVWRESNMRQKASYIGIIATVFGCIILCEFVYINNFAVPDAQTVVWRTKIEAASSLSAPAVALIQNLDKLRSTRAILLNNTVGPPTNCSTDAASNDSRYCFQTWGSSVLPSLNYVLFDARTYPNLSANDYLNLYYTYNINTTAAENPDFGFALIDPQLLADNNLTELMGCGVITQDVFPARGRTRMSVEVLRIADDVHAIDYTGLAPGCRKFRQYYSYRASVIPLGQTNEQDRCDVAKYNDPSPCVNNVNIKFSSMLVTTQTSGKLKGWKEMLIDEGSIVGAVQFVCWFLGIFVM